MDSIMFKAPMVRAILDGRKTQTRRIVKLDGGWKVHPNYEGVKWPVRKDGDRLIRMKFPYGKPGDRLWVRETWQPVEFDNGCIGVVYHATPSTDDGLNAIHWYNVGEDEMLKWQLRSGRRFPSIHMPRWASRITIEVTDVRVERLNDINEEDAIAEGIFEFGSLGLFGHDKNGTPGPMVGASAVEAYYHLWETINGKGSWDANPWVWVIGFKKIDFDGKICRIEGKK